MSKPCSWPVGVMAGRLHFCSRHFTFNDDGAASAIAGMMAVARALADNDFLGPDKDLGNSKERTY
ncbi:hypothetical protein ACIPZ5_09350 [Pseudomonas sp. NPDC089428]|uniref:hypothetical protein n=1 Tax=Pseudomonas sp. NPDC089428 TaxID=3364467 RepID=UPI0037F89108